MDLVPERDTEEILQTKEGESRVTEMVAVKSSNITAVGYNPNTRELHIHFRGGAQFVYTDVSRETFLEFMAAESKGAYFYGKIRGNYKHSKVLKEA